MHGSIRNDLEHVLEGKAKVSETIQHLAACEECTGEVSAMQEQKNLLRSWRASEEVEPAAGFYARVMQRIEQRTKHSIWWIFVYSPFGKRLALASLSIAVALGSYVVTEEKLDGHLLETPASQQEQYNAPMEGDQAQLRDAVLQNFAVRDNSK